MNHTNIFQKLFFKKSSVIHLFPSAFLLIVIIIFCCNILTFLLPTLDQFSVFHRYDKVYSIVDWNLPHVVSVDIDNNSIDEVVTPSGCVFLTTIDISTIANRDALCTDKLVHEGNTFGFKIPQANGKFVRSFLAIEGDSWLIVVQTVSETKRYFISPMGLISERNTPLAVNLDSQLYLLSHLYTLML